MNERQLQNQLLAFAVNEALQWLRLVPQLRRIHVYQRVLKCIVDKWTEHDQELHSFDLTETGPHEYAIRVNEVDTTLTIPRKEAPDDH